MKKGFTLIELLAVIVILAIIAVIAVPIVLNIIDESKDNATLRSADFYLDAAEMAVANSTLKDKNIADGDYDIKDGDICLNEACTDILEVEVNGEVPTSGTITIKNGNITGVNLFLNGKTIRKNDEGKLVYDEGEVVGSEKACTIERQNENKYSIGDVVTCYLSETTDKFYIIEEQPLIATHVKMITEKIIHTTEFRQNDRASAIEFSTTEYWSSGITDFSNVFDDPRNDGAKPVVDGYVNYLNLTLTDATGTLLTLSQAEFLGCSLNEASCAPGVNGGGNAPAWLYDSSFYLASVTSYEGVLMISSEGSFFGVGSDFNVPFTYVRPVIIMQTSDIK